MSLAVNFQNNFELIIIISGVVIILLSALISTTDNKKWKYFSFSSLFVFVIISGSVQHKLTSEKQNEIDRQTKNIAHLKKELSSISFQISNSTTLDLKNYSELKNWLSEIDNQYRDFHNELVSKTKKMLSIEAMDHEYNLLPDELVELVMTSESDITMKQINLLLAKQRAYLLKKELSIPSGSLCMDSIYKSLVPWKCD